MNEYDNSLVIESFLPTFNWLQKNYLCVCVLSKLQIDISRYL